MNTLAAAHQSDSLADAFARSGLVTVDHFISDDVAELCYLYTQMQIQTGRFRETVTDESKEAGFRGRTNGCYGDVLMESLLQRSTPLMEAITGCDLWPTYSYIRQYYQGADLAKHTDRPASEYNASITLGYDYNNLPSRDYVWPIYVDGERVTLGVGSAAVFKGREKAHWREALLGNSHCQLILNWVDQRSEWAQYCKYDGRPWLGAPAQAKFPALEQAYLKKLKQTQGQNG